MTGRHAFLTAAILAALAGLAASFYAYVTPDTGVDDTAGPLLAALGHAGMAGAALLVLTLARARGIMIALFLLAAVGTCLAGFMLHQPLILLPAILALALLPVGLMLGDSR